VGPCDSSPLRSVEGFKDVSSWCVGVNVGPPGRLGEPGGRAGRVRVGLSVSKIVLVVKSRSPDLFRLKSRRPDHFIYNCILRCPLTFLKNIIFWIIVNCYFFFYIVTAYELPRLKSFYFLIPKILGYYVKIFNVLILP
jgi:hypothetical protein